MIEEYDCLYHMSRSFSDSLEILHLYNDTLGPLSGFIPQYKSSVCTFGFFNA